MPLLRQAAERMNDASKVAGGEEGETFVVIGAGRDAGWVTWAWEVLMIYLAAGRVRIGAAKKMISAGSAHSLVTSRKKGGVWSFGSGMYGKLGHGGSGLELETGQMVPRAIRAFMELTVTQVAAGAHHSLALTTTGDVFTWGWGCNGALGHGHEGNQSEPKKVRGLANMIAIAGGNGCSLAIQEGGSLYRWGGTRKLPGLPAPPLWGVSHGPLTPFEVPTVVGAVDVTTGEYHDLVLTRKGTVLVRRDWPSPGSPMGIADTNVPGDAFTVLPGLRCVVDIGAGKQHSIALTATGRVYTWGKELATGLHVDGTCYDAPGTYQVDWLVPTQVTGGGIGDAVVVQVAAGSDHSMAVTAEGDLYTWGKGTEGQLGHGKPGDARFLVGDDVVAQHSSGQWFEGTIANDDFGGSGRIEINWHDGDTSEVVGAEQVRQPRPRDLAVPKIVAGITSVVTGATGGNDTMGNSNYSLVTTEEGCVLAFGMQKFWGQTDGALGLGPGVGQATAPTVIEGITVGGGQGGEGKDGKNE